MNAACSCIEPEKTFLLIADSNLWPVRYRCNDQATELSKCNPTGSLSALFYRKIVPLCLIINPFLTKLVKLKGLHSATIFAAKYYTGGFGLFLFWGGGWGGEIEYLNLFIHVCDRKGLGQFNPLRFPVSSTLTIRNSCLYKRLTNRLYFLYVSARPYNRYTVSISHDILLNSDWTDISLAPIMEGFVILKKNPEYEKTESWVVQTTSSL